MAEGSNVKAVGRYVCLTTLDNINSKQNLILKLMDIFQGVWEQYDGQLILWTPYWAPDDPNGGTGQNCGAVGLRKDAYAGKWADDPCTNSHYYICERSG